MASLDQLLPVKTLTFSISISASSDSNSSFSIQDALSTYSGWGNANVSSYYAVQGPGTLFHSGCVVDGILNCTAACQDVNQIFADPHTFQNCMVVASLTVLGSAVTFDNSTANVTLDASSTALVEDFSIHIDEPDFQSLASGVNQTIQDCLQQYPNKHPGYDGPFWPWYVIAGAEQVNFPTFTSCCYDLTVPLNADVGGIGVYISYWLQSGISLSAFMALKLCEKAPYRTRLRRILPALKSATVEFHKAQCFFMLAINIATQIVLTTGTLNEGTASLQGLYNNYVLIESVALSGVLPVPFMLLTLHSVGIRSWYVLTLSSCTIALSAATLFITGSFNPSPADLLRLRNQVSGSFPACGIRDPSNYCLQTNPLTLNQTDIGPGSIGVPIVAFTTIILALIFFDYCGVQNIATCKRFIGWWVQKFKSVSKSNQPQRSPQAHQFFSLGFYNASNYVSPFLYFITWSCYLLFWAYYLQSLKLGASVGVVQTWTFGQIVAISVWAQPLCEYVKLSVQGLKRGLQYRISDPYIIVKKPDKSKTPRVRAPKKST